MYNKLISVIVPVYNSEQFLQQCIDSILAQTFTDFELILVDDGSPDACPAICDDYAQKDKRIHVIHQANQGQAAARNRAVKCANGKWICFIDSDDIVHHQALELLYQTAVENDAGISMCGVIEAEEVSETFEENIEPISTSMEANEMTMMELYEHGEYDGWVVWGKLIRKEIVEGIPFTEGRVYEDNAVVCRWLIEAKTIASMESQLYFYRINTLGTTKGLFSLKKLDFLWALEEMIRFYKSIRYHTLVKRFCRMYILSAVEFYWKVRKELNAVDVSDGISKRLRCMYRMNSRYLDLTREQRLILYDVIYPRRMQIYWLAQAGITVVKQNGVFELVRRISKRFRIGA